MRFFSFLFVIGLLSLASPDVSEAQCTRILPLTNVSPNSRGGTIIYKSNWSRARGREQSFQEGNHSQKGGAILVYYKSGFAPNTSRVPVYTMAGSQIATMGRFPRCTRTGCGQHERWYFRGPGASQASIPQIARLSGGAFLIGLKGGICASVSDAYSNRSTY